jgi:hypothetical protein
MLHRMDRRVDGKASQSSQFQLTIYCLRPHGSTTTEASSTWIGRMESCSIHVHPYATLPCIPCCSLAGQKLHKAAPPLRWHFLASILRHLDFREQQQSHCNPLSGSHQFIRRLHRSILSAAFLLSRRQCSHRIAPSCIFKLLDSSQCKRES